MKPATGLTSQSKRRGRPRRAGWVAAAVLLCTLALPAQPARAQAGGIELEIDLRPEYDRPQVLVIYWVRLPASAALPSVVRLPIPSVAGEPFAVGMMSEEGGAPLQGVYTLEARGEWTDVVLQMDSRLAQVEYYLDLPIESDQRQFTFVWPGGLPLTAFHYAVQEPVGAEAMRVDPPAAAALGPDGLVYHRGDLGPQPASAQITLSFRYRKAGAGLSIEALQPAAPLSAAERARSFLLRESWLRWAVLGLGLALLAGGGLAYWRSREAGAAPARRTRRRGTRAAPPEPEQATAVFCHQCGAQAGASDRFCRRCGAALRT